MMDVIQIFLAVLFSFVGSLVLTAIFIWLGQDRFKLFALIFVVCMLLIGATVLILLPHPEIKLDSRENNNSHSVFEGKVDNIELLRVIAYVKNETNRGCLLLCKEGGTIKTDGTWRIKIPENDTRTVYFLLVAEQFPAHESVDCGKLDKILSLSSTIDWTSWGFQDGC